jgi:hypothetical protein
MEVLIFIAIFSIAVGLWANAWGRSGWIWGICAGILSPLVVAIVLIFSGKTIEKKAEEINALKALTDK